MQDCADPVTSPSPRGTCSNLAFVLGSGQSPLMPTRIILHQDCCPLTRVNDFSAPVLFPFSFLYVQGNEGTVLDLWF